MSHKAKNIQIWEIISLVAIGAMITGLCHDTIMKEYKHQWFEELTFACFWTILPATTLGFIRREISQKNGDWKILIAFFSIIAILLWLLPYYHRKG